MGKVYSVKGNRDLEEIAKSKKDEKHFIFRDKDNDRRVEIDLSPRLIIFVLLILALIFYSKQLVMILMFVFFAFVVMSSIRPVVNWFVKMKISKGWAVALSYFLFIVIIQAILVLVLVPFVNQLAGLVSVLPSWIDDIFDFLKNFSIGGYSLGIEVSGDYINNIIKSIPSADNFKNVADFISRFFEMGAFFVTSIVFSIYLVLEHDALSDLLLIRIVSNEKRERVKKLLNDVETKLGSWVLGQGVISTLAAVFSGIVLTILGVPFAFPLAIITGLLGVIPSLGSTIAGFLMGLVTLIAVGPIQAVILVAAFVLYQPLENSVITPRVMGNAVGLKPFIVLLGVMSFIFMFGIFGGFIAVPLIVIMKILYEFYIDLQKLKAKGIV